MMQSDLGPYDELVAQSCASLVDAVIELPWLAMPQDVADRDRTLTQVLYIRNLLRVTEYCEALTEPIWSAVIDHALQVDVGIQVELDELEEKGLEPTDTVNLADVLDRDVHEINGEEEQSLATSPGEDPKDGSGSDLDMLENLSDEDGYDASDSLNTVAIKEEPAWSEIAVLSGKLDAIMKTVFDFLSHWVGHKQRSSTADVRCYQLFQTLLGIFARSILTTFKSRHVQFILFWYSSLDPEFTDMFLGTLLSKSLYVMPGAGNANAANVASASILRAGAAGYVASYVARAKFVDGSTTRMVVLNLCTYMDACLESFTSLGANAPPPGARDHTIFYAVAQAVFYIFCFRWRDLRDGGTLAHDSSLVPHSDEDSAHSLAATYPAAYSFELSPQLLPSLGGTGVSFASVSSNHSGANVPISGWSLGLAVVQRAITSPLNPLRYCNVNVVHQFAYVAQYTGFLYCYSILDTNVRRSAKEASTCAPNTPLHEQNGVNSSTRESTPVAHSKRLHLIAGASDTPAPIAAKSMDVFFPFDPYRLPRSNAYTEPVYREWSEVAPDGEEDDEEQDADEDVEELQRADVGDDSDECDGPIADIAHARRAKLSAFVPRCSASRLAAFPSSSDPSITPEFVAQSLETMSISPYNG
ncbi:hypothetical protein MVES_000949 [Malassezia vespertilionis]|uniref:RNA polymerase I-specific transcription initiation factor RRN3 n=1 Tax=Malassezia vespertilionis TaxID=2020962 RepID=A0A2N1JDS2_9BASI|nr:hypothetical protein MVES_000949 [Malassezia vespertilionis]